MRIIPQDYLRHVTRCVFSAALLLATQHLIAAEADVLAAELVHLKNQEYRINVTVQHADSGWDHYANKWIVVDQRGNTLGTRVLLHPHENEQPFTRGLSLKIPAEVSQITVIAFDSEHKKGGKTITLNVAK